MSESPQNLGSPPTPAAAAEAQRDALVGFLKDNLEAIAIAVIMALVIKHFCVEAFKIPTHSMKPALLGDGATSSDSVGDRIVVDKWAYFLDDPSRWDVVVFRYPLNRSRNFIKRVGGLPGEHLRVSEDGDLWVRKAPPEGEAGAPLRIARKPRRIREQLYVPVYPDPELLQPDGSGRSGGAESVNRYWMAGDGPPSAWRLESHARFVFGGGVAAEIHNRRKIRDHDRSGYDGPYRWDHTGPTVRDARFRADVTVDDTEAGAENTPAEFSLSWRPDGEFQAVLTLSSTEGGSRAFLRRGAHVVQERALQVILVPGRTVAVELEYVDGDLRARLDDREVAVLPDGRTFEDTDVAGEEQRFSIRAQGLPLTVNDVRVDRDLRYQADWPGNSEARRHGVRVPEDSYFMLGDNTGASSDSRKWEMSLVTLQDGTEIRYETGQVRDLNWNEKDGSLKQVQDLDGILRTWREEDEDTRLGTSHVPAPFVRRELIVGRAFLIFWPCIPDFPGRLGFLH